jgi:hypothetical protein
MRPETDLPRRTGVTVLWRETGLLSPVLMAVLGALVPSAGQAQPMPGQAQPMPGQVRPMPGQARPMAAGGMPDLRAMSGKPLPDRGMALGTVTVRVARKTPANPVANVEIMAITEAPGGESRKRTAKTDAGGRALFESLPVGNRFHAEVVIDGEKLATETFAVPEVGGIRTMLIAGLGARNRNDDGNAGEGQGEGAPAGDGTQQPFRLGFISGSVKPDTALPAGTVEVAAFDETGRPIGGKSIELGYIRPGGHVEVARQSTGADGVARFSNIAGPAPAADGTAGEVGAAVVMQHGGMRVGSDGFNLPTKGGVKVELRVPARTADPSVITIGAGGRIILQLRDETVSFIETLPLENQSNKLFDPGPGGVEIPLPSEFTSADVVPGEHKIEIRKGIGVAVHGIIPPRRPQTGDPNFKSPDEVTFGFVLPATGSTREFEQKFPTGMGEFTFITDQLPGLTIESTQISGARQERELGAKKFWLMHGDPIPRGGTLQFTVRGLPAPSTTGRSIAATLALALVAAAFLFGRRGGTPGRPDAASERDRLVNRREKLFSDLVAMETQKLGDSGDRGDRSLRGDLVKKLESIYREIAAVDERHAV